MSKEGRFWALLFLAAIVIGALLGLGAKYLGPTTDMPTALCMIVGAFASCCMVGLVSFIIMVDKVGG